MKHEAKYKSTNKSSGLMKLANVAVQVATVKTGNTGKLLTVYQGDQMIHKGSMVDGLNDNWDYANKLKADRQAKQNRG